MGNIKVYYCRVPIRITFETQKQGYYICIQDINEKYSNYFINGKDCADILNLNNRTKVI